MQSTKISVVVMAVAVMVSVAAASQHQTRMELDDPGTTPDSILYGLDRAMESVSLAMARSPEAKAEKRLEIAEERLSESRDLAQRNRSDLANETAREYNDNVDEARRFGDQIAEAAQRQDIESVISQATSVHMTVLENEDVDPAEPGYQAKVKAEKTTVETENDAVEKTRKQAKIAGHRVNESQRLVEKNRTDLAARTAEKYGEEMEELSDFGAQISDLAQKQKVDQLVANATMIHAEVLSTVYERVPEQAKAGISRALNQSVKGHQEAVAAMQARGEDVQGMNITDRIPSDVRQQAGIDVGAMRDRAEARQQERDGGQNMTSSGTSDGTRDNTSGMSQDGQDTRSGR